ncbi:hypothetical protein UXO48_22745 [Enterobacter hormaechei]
MSTQPTNLPVPSESPRDLKFNAGKIDEFVTSLELKYVDRFGGEHYTIEGLRWLIQQAISSMGWVLIDSFQDGADITLPNQALRDEVSGEYYRWDGPLPKHVDAGSTPASSGGVGVGAWVGIGDASLRAYLATVAGAASIGLQPGGNLQQAITWVTPEQFGAIGDGTAHPLSERYATLAAAQAVYPFVTSLTQTIDWAACQLAENLNRKVRPIHVAKFKKYHLGDNYLKLGPYSTWIAPPLNDFVWDTGFIRSVPTDYSSYAFGQLCIVRVGDASEFTGDGVTGSNVRNITFKGFQLRWDVARHTPSKGVGTICLHMNNAMKMNLDVCLYGGEFAAFGYSCWGTQGSIKMDSCHKGVYWDALSASPERPAGGSTTSHNVELQIDHTIFPVYLRNCNYAKFHGWFEGALTSMAHYDSANETAMGITLDSCDGVIFDMGVEAWQGALLNCIGSVEAEFSFAMLPGEVLPSGLGTQGVAYRIRSLMSSTDETAIPSANRSLSYVNGYSTVTVKHWQPVVSNWPTGSSTKYVTSVDATSKVTFQDCGMSLGGGSTLGGGDARLKLAPANYANIEAIGGMYIERYLKPSSSYDYVGRSVSVHNAWQGATIAADGTVTINAPTNFKIVDFTAMVGVSTNAQPSGVGIKSSSDTSIVLQTTANASYGINYRLWVKPTL